MEDTARRVRELQAEAEATTQHVEQSKKERVRVSLQLRKQQRTLEVGLGFLNWQQFLQALDHNIVLRLILPPNNLGRVERTARRDSESRSPH